MSARLDIPFTLDADAAFEGMILAGRRVYRGGGRWVWLGMTLLLGVLVPLGSVSMFILVHLFVTGDIPSGGLWFMVAYAVGGALGVLIMNAVYKRMARLVVASDFGRGGRMICDADGVTLSTGASTWQTGWPDVEELVIGKKSLGVVISGIVLILPLSAFEGKEAMKDAHARLSEWFHAATERAQ